MITLKDRIKNIIEHQKSVSLRFLNLEEQSKLQRIPQAELFGGYQDAERKRAYFFGKPLDNIIPVNIRYNEKYLTLSHQNILGTLLSLGITLDSIGDILPKQGIFFMTQEISKEVFASFTEIKRVSITLEIFEGEVHSEQEFEEYRTTVESLRLDLVVSKIVKNSRKESTEMIVKDLVKVNHQVCSKSTIILKDNDILSIRKYGRFKIINTEKRSKKNKIVLIYAKYI